MMEPTILVADDEPAILNAIKKIFHRLKLQIRTAVNPIDVLRILGEMHFSVRVLDYSMPGKTGAELLAQARSIRSDTVRILLSGNNVQTACIAVINQSHTPVTHRLSANSA